eukprot:1108165_1
MKWMPISAIFIKVSITLQFTFSTLNECFEHKVFDVAALHSKHRWFNTGFCIYDLNHWRQYNLTQKCLYLMYAANAYGIKYKKKLFRLFTQTIWNVLYIMSNPSVSIGKIDSRWNVVGMAFYCNSRKRGNFSFLEKQGILHWSGSNCKPWLKDRKIQNA